MSSTYASPLDLVERGLDELASIGPEFRSTSERQEFLLRISRVIGRAEAERLRVLAACDDIAEASVWLARDQCFMTGQVLQVNGGLTLRRNPLGPDFERAEREDRERAKSAKPS